MPLNGTAFVAVKSEAGADLDISDRSNHSASFVSSLKASIGRSGVRGSDCALESVSWRGTI